MKEAPYTHNKGTDDWFPDLIDSGKKHMKDNNDDTLFLFIGETGTGKSNLALHALETYNPNVGSEAIALRKDDWAKKQYECVERFSKGQKDNQLLWDEASNISRDAMSTFMKDVIKLMYQNRAAQIMHYWCWPSLRIFEKEFLYERVKGVFFCYGKWSGLPRIYYFFPKKSINAMLEDGLELTNYNLKKNAAKYALYKGRFTKYTGKLLDSYADIKAEGVVSASKEFKEKYSGAEGAELMSGAQYSAADIAKHVGVSDETIRRIVKELVGLGQLHVIDYGGNKKYTSDQVELIKSYMITRKSIRNQGGVALLPPLPSRNNRVKEKMQ